MCRARRGKWSVEGGGYGLGVGVDSLVQYDRVVLRAWGWTSLLGCAFVLYDSV